jgi:hypothetical protein
METTTVNVKGVSTTSWSNARAAAARADVAMGAWLSKAIDEYVNAETGPTTSTEHPHLHLTPEQLTDRISAVAALLQAQAALKAATGKVTGRAMASAVIEGLKQAQQGLLPPPQRTVRGFTSGKERAQFGIESGEEPVENGQAG